MAKPITRTKLTLSLAFLASTSIAGIGCGGVDVEEPTDELSSGDSRQTEFKHGTPPGPAPWDYFLTSYTDHSTPACGGKMIDGAWYYSTGAYTFGCGARLKLEANGKCVVVAVVDNGPAAWVESKAKNKCGKTGYIIDASPLVSKHLFGTSSAGWSDCYAIKVSQVAKSTATGPVACDSVGGGSDPGSGGTDPGPSSGSSFIGDACAQASDCSGGICMTEAEGFVGGTCSKSCTSLCPDQPGKAVTFCVELSGAGRCVSRCDTELHPGTGCREGYRCVKMPRRNQDWVERNVCLPESGSFSHVPGASPADEEGDLPNPESIVGSGCSLSTDGGVATGLPLALALALLLGIARRRRG